MSFDPIYLIQTGNSQLKCAVPNSDKNIEISQFLEKWPWGSHGENALLKQKGNQKS